MTDPQADPQANPHPSPDGIPETPPDSVVDVAQQVQQAETGAQETAKNKPLWTWLIPAIAGLAGVGFGALITWVAVRNTITPADSPPPAAVESAPDSQEARAEAFRERQRFVSEVVNQLGRDVLIGDSPTRGNPDASVVLIEFSDFQCPYCAQTATEVDAFVDDHSEDVLFVYKHLPLTQIHPEAVPAALASWAAQQQGQFWPFHDALFANQDRLGEALYVEIATDLNLDMDQFNADRTREEAQAAIARDLALAAELRLNSTPVFLMNDLLIPGAVPADFFREALVRIQEFQRQGTDGGEAAPDAANPSS
jgi:protein-disulfide isomerase